MTSTPQDPWQRSGDAAAPQSGSASLVDPEDDVTSSYQPTHYGSTPRTGTAAGDGAQGADFTTTTAIPRYDGAPSGMGLMNEPDPLPYVSPPTAFDQPYGGGPALIEPDNDDRDRMDRRRGTQDLGLLLLRWVAAAMLIGAGLQNAFGLWGGPGLGGYQDTLTELGFQYADILTYVGAGTLIAAGVLLVLGLFTPLAAAAALGYLVNALLAAVATDGPSFFLPDGQQHLILMIAVVAAVILVGPGRYGFDGGRGWARRPFIGSTFALLAGIGGGVAVWVLLNGANPLA